MWISDIRCLNFTSKPEREAKIPSEMEVAPCYTLLALFTLFTLFSLFILFKLLYIAKTVAQMPIYIVIRLECCCII